MGRALVAFDFDGTLSDSEMTVLLGERMGEAARMRAITKRAMNDEIGYARSLRDRVALLAGLQEREALAALDEVSLRPGAADVLRSLTETPSVRTAILTGGFERGVRRALDRAAVSVDRIVANRLVIEDGALTGEVDGPLIDVTKDEVLVSLADDFGIDLEDVIAVGDGANDLPMLRVAGLAVGFRPKPTVRPQCDVVVADMVELDAVLSGQLAAEDG